VVSTQAVEGNRHNVIARIGEPRLLLVGHMDTIGPGDSKNWQITKPLEPIAVDGRLYGLGAVDILTAAKETKNIRDLWLILDIGKEHTFERMKKFVDEFKISPELAVFAEPTDLRIEDSHRGCFEIYITVYGKSAHAGHPNRGGDASSLYTVLTELKKRNPS
jgi:acetylornithine deacetylase/succinyl-diaminopimelate desuccinylase-like protein